MEQPARILVVDDDGEAFLACRRAEFDVILMDKNMPGPSGLDLLPGFRRTYPRTHIIMMTAFGDVPSYTEATEKGGAERARSASRLPAHLHPDAHHHDDRVRFFFL